MTVRIGIIGAGSIGNVHADAAEKAGSTVTAVWDVKVEKAQKLADAHPGVEVCVSLEDLLARDDVDGVVVAVPNALHKEIAIAAITAGKDVLLEKPMAMNVAECDEIIAAKAASDRIVQLGFVSRYTPAVRSVKEFIDDGHFGRIYHAKAFMYRRRGIPGLGRWFTTRATSGGGVLIDLGVHMVDLARYLAEAGDAKRVSAACTSMFGPALEGYTYVDMWAGPPDYEGVFDVDDGAVGLIRFEGGLTLELNCTWAANLPEKTMPNGVVLFGEKAGAFIELWENEVRIATVQGGQLVDWMPQLPGGEVWDLAFAHEHELYAEAITSREPPRASVEDGRAVQAVLDAMYRSSDEGREVEV